MDPKRNISTEHQGPGDARRPDDTLDRKQTMDAPEGEKPFMAKKRREGLSEARGVNDGQEDQIHQAVENQGSVTPEDYPESERAR